MCSWIVTIGSGLQRQHSSPVHSSFPRQSKKDYPSNALEKWKICRKKTSVTSQTAGRPLTRLMVNGEWSDLVLQLVVRIEEGSWKLSEWGLPKPLN